MKDLKSDIEYEMRNYDELSVEQKTEIKHRSDTTGHLFWKKTYHWDETIHHTESTVTSVIRNLDKYRLQCEKLINERIKFSINIKSIEERIKQIIINIFDISDDKFDKEEILDVKWFDYDEIVNKMESMLRGNYVRTAVINQNNNLVAPIDIVDILKD